MNPWAMFTPTLRRLASFGGAGIQTNLLWLEARPALVREFACPTDQRLMEKTPKGLILFLVKSRL